MARSGRKAWGLDSASLRRMSTASSEDASASSRRPRSESRIPRLLRLAARSGRKAWGLDAASLRYRSDASSRGRQRLLTTTQVGKQNPQVVEAHGQVGQEGLRVGRGQLAAEVRPPAGASASSRRPGRTALPRLLRLMARSGRKAWGLASASLRYRSDASSDADSASSRRPRSESRFPRLLRLMARSGRKAWGLEAASLRRMATASCEGASASSRRPRAESATAQVVKQARSPGFLACREHKQFCFPHSCYQLSQGQRSFWLGQTCIQPIQETPDFIV